MSKPVGVDGLTDSERLQLKTLSEIHNRLSELLAVSQDILAVNRDALTETKDTNTRQRIKDRAPTEPAKPQTPQVCKDWTRKDGSVKNGCGALVRWGKVDGKSTLLNPDGTKHFCHVNPQP